MKRGNMFKRLLCTMLVIAMLAVYAVPVYAEQPKGFKVEQVDNSEVSSALNKNEMPENIVSKLYKDSDVVRVSIVLKSDSTIEKGYSTQGIADNASAMRYRQTLEAVQAQLEKRIATEALDGEELDVVWNLTLVANIISANVRYGDIEAIKAVNGVEDVIIETQYAPSTATRGDASPNMTVSTGMTGAQNAWLEGYTGAGSLVAIIDTGLDVYHQSFDNDAYLYAMEENMATSGKSYDVLTAEKIAAVADQLNIEGFTADDLYYNDKIPFGYNYIDGDLDIIHMNDAQGEHGSHVAGIAAANRYIAVDGTYVEAADAVKVVGNAPDAQVMVMKVFGKGGGAYDSDYMAAIEDAIVLGADAVNLSLGSASTGMATSATYQDVMESLVNSDTVVVMSSGNNGYWAETATTYLYYDDVNFATGGSPGSYTNSLGVASVDNDGTTGFSFGVNGKPVYYTENPGYGNAPLTSLAENGEATYEYVFIDGNGYESDYTDIDLSGKIVICQRGDISFAEKANIGAFLGAAAVVIYNNTAGIFGALLDGYEHTVPVVTIQQKDGAYIKESSEEQMTEAGLVYYTGEMTISGSIGSENYNSDYYTMSAFSSWGVPSDLSLKPEITAPGGSIYSLYGSTPEGGGVDQYEMMSGTSMAAPQITGMMAVVMQYIRENDLHVDGMTDRALAQSLLMSTAVPMVDGVSGSYYPVFQQGAGLANVYEAVTSNSYIVMGNDATVSANDGKVKVELGDDPARKGTYSFSFSLNNISDEDLQYNLYADIFTQDMFDVYLATWTATLLADVTFAVDGVALKNQNVSTDYDFNGDGICTVSDAQALMDYVVLDEALAYNAENADVDADSDVDTADVVALLKLMQSAYAYVPANGSVDVTVTIALTEDEKAYLDTYYVNGAYIEAYVFAEEVPNAEGVAGVTHSIPVLGFYGNWTDASMFDHAEYVETSYGIIDRYPYLYQYLLDPDTYEYYSNVFNIVYGGDPTEYVFGGNPYAYDAQYLPERNAMNNVNGSYLSSLLYTQIRNAGAMVLEIKDVETGEIYVLAGDIGPYYAAYYNSNTGAWQNVTQEIGLGWPGVDAEGNALPEGTTVEVSVHLIPEYYVNTDGSVNFSAIGEGTAMSTMVTIDNTAPSIVGEPTVDENGVMNLTVSDNEYVAFVILYGRDGATLVDYVNPDQTESGEIDIQIGYDLADDIYMIQVIDYADNISTYRLFHGVEPTTEVEGITLSDSELLLIKSNSYQLMADVQPFNLVDRSVIWTSSDESVAVVDENGVVTAVGAGTAVITAAAVLNPEITASCAVEVVAIEKELNAVVWDENGEVWFSEFNTGSLPAYTKLTESSCNAPIASVAYGADGKLYGASADTGTGDFLSSLYEIDPVTFETTLIGNSTIGYADLAPAYNLGENIMLGVYGPYVVLIDTVSGDYIGDFNWGPTELVGITYEGSALNTYYNQYIDIYMILDADGNLYEEAFIQIGTQYGYFSGPEGGLIGNMGTPTDMFYFQSLFLDNEMLYISNFVEADNDVTLYAWDLYDTGNIYSLGNFADSVWPVGGLFHLDAAEQTTGTDADYAEAVINENAVFTNDVELISVNGVNKGAVNAVSHSGNLKPNSDIVIDSEDDNLLTVNVTAQNAEGLDVDATNGLSTVTYDPAAMTLKSVHVAADISSVKYENGKVTIGYAGLDVIPDGDTVATLVFEVADGAKVEATVNHQQVNNDHIDVDEELPHSYESVVTPPTCTEQGYTTHTCTECGYSYVDSYVDALGHDYEAVVTPPTCTEDGYTTYTCSVCGDSYVDDVVKATGHDFEKGECTVCGEEDPKYNPEDSADTGDTFSTMWIVLMTVSMVGAAVLVFSRKKFLVK